VTIKGGKTTTRGRGKKAKKGLLSPRASGSEQNSDAMASDSDGRAASKKEKQSTDKASSSAQSAQGADSNSEMADLEEQKESESETKKPPINPLEDMVFGEGEQLKNRVLDENGKPFSL
jgi:hypothetical protein